jgi:hypothetical protein
MCLQFSYMFAILTFGCTAPTWTFAILIRVCNSHVFIIGSPHNIVPYIGISMNVKELRGGSLQLANYLISLPRVSLRVTITPSVYKKRGNYAVQMCSLKTWQLGIWYSPR